MMLTSSKVEARRTHSGARVHPAVHRQRGVLVAVPADLHRARGLLRRADELVDLRLDRAVELDRLHRAGVDHPAVAAVRGHVDASWAPARADHAAQVRLRRDRDGRGVPAVPADGGHDRQERCPRCCVVAILAVFAVSELLLSPIGLSVTTKLAPEAFRAQMMALYFFSVGLGTSMSGVLAKYYDAGAGIRLLRNHRCGRDRRGRDRVRCSRRGSAEQMEGVH